MSGFVDEKYIKNHLINNDSLFNYIYVIEQNFDTVPNTYNHYGASINYQDLKELRQEFLDELYDSIVDWVYSSEKYKELKDIAISNGKQTQQHRVKFQDVQERNFGQPRIVITY